MDEPAIDPAFFLDHYFDTVMYVRIRALAIGPCADPECDCKNHPAPLLYFARPAVDVDEWVFLKSSNLDKVEEADERMHETFADGECFDNIACFAALAGAPWAEVLRNPDYIARAHTRASKVLGDNGYAIIRELGAEAVREQFTLREELWR